MAIILLSSGVRMIPDDQWTGTGKKSAMAVDQENAQFTLFDTRPQTHNPSKYVRTGQGQRSRSPEVKVSKGQGLCQSFQGNTDTGDYYR